MLLLLSLASCSTTYSSVEQASTACNSWKEKGEIINYNHDLTWTEKFWKFNKTNPEPSIETLEWENWFEKRKLYFASSPLLGLQCCPMLSAAVVELTPLSKNKKIKIEFKK